MGQQRPDVSIHHPLAIERGITDRYGTGIWIRVFGRDRRHGASGGLRDRAVIATKAGLEWRTESVAKSSPAQSAKRSRSRRAVAYDYIDLYQVHWPDPLVPIQETEQTLAGLLKERSARSVCPLLAAQMAEFGRSLPFIGATSIQPL